MATIRKRKLASGDTRWQVDYRDQEGSRRHKQFATKREADAWLVQARAQVAAGTHVVESASITVSQACELWVSQGTLEELEESTLRQRRQHTDLHIKPAIGSVKLSKLSTPAVEAFRDKLVGTLSRPLARAVLSSFKGVLSEARRRGHLHKNPAEDTVVRISSRDEDEVAVPSKEHIRVIVEKVPERWRALILTALFTGLRASELRGLTWDNVDLKAAVLHVRQRADFRNVIGPTKTKAGRRKIPLAPIVVDTLKAWRVAGSGRSKPRDKLLETGGSRALDLVFPSRRGRILTATSIHKQCWRPLQLQNGMVKPGSRSPETPDGQPLYTFHSLRHAAASLFIEQGWSPKRVQQVMGHSSITVTYDTYGHLWPSDEDDRASMISIEDRLLRSNIEEA